MSVNTACDKSKNRADDAEQQLAATQKAKAASDTKSQKEIASAKKEIAALEAKVAEAVRHADNTQEFAEFTLAQADERKAATEKLVAKNGKLLASIEEARKQSDLATSKLEKAKAENQAKIDENQKEIARLGKIVAADAAQKQEIDVAIAVQSALKDQNEAAKIQLAALEVERKSERQKLDQLVVDTNNKMDQELRELEKTLSELTAKNAEDIARAKEVASSKFLFPPMRRLFDLSVESPDIKFPFLVKFSQSYFDIIGTEDKETVAGRFVAEIIQNINSNKASYSAVSDLTDDAKSYVALIEATPKAVLELWTKIRPKAGEIRVMVDGKPKMIDTSSYTLSTEIIENVRVKPVLNIFSRNPQYSNSALQVAKTELKHVQVNLMDESGNVNLSQPNMLIFDSNEMRKCRSLSPECLSVLVKQGRFEGVKVVNVNPQLLNILNPAKPGDKDVNTDILATDFLKRYLGMGIDKLVDFHSSNKDWQNDLASSGLQVRKRNDQKINTGKKSVDNYQVTEVDLYEMYLSFEVVTYDEAYENIGISTDTKIPLTKGDDMIGIPSMPSVSMNPNQRIEWLQQMFQAFK